ncbi:MAG: diguanylate cyclase [Candidatus Sericytochromatia bacterium]|nr:diguanylate cyclase [Candidatus Tanganyikabacteria bacterium]
MHVRLKLAIKLAVVFSAVCASLLFLVASIAAVLTTRGIHNEAFKRLDNDTAVMLHTFDYFKDNALASAQMFASHPRVAAFARSGGKMRTDEVRRLLEILDERQLLKVYDAQGTLLLQRGFWPGNRTDVPEMPSPGLQLALVGETVKGLEAIGDLGLAVRGIAPIREGNEVVGAVLVGSRLDQAFADQLKQITGLEVGVAVGDSRRATWLAQSIRDAGGQPLTGSIEAPIIASVRDSGAVAKSTLSLGDQEHLAAFAPLFGDYSQFVGMLFIGEPSAPLNARIHQAQLFIALLSLLACGLAFLAANLVAKTITDPIRKLAGHATTVASGRLDTQLDLRTGDELEQLAEAFNVMTESLAIMKFNDQNANPLTKLPGNLVIETEVQRRLELGEQVAVLYVDLDNFKAFNDKFGFEAGDRIIQFTAEILKDAVQFVDHAGDFIGHIGGDDFIIMSQPNAADDLCREIIRRFDAQVLGFYPPDDRERGYIVSVDRQGQVQRFGICSLSIAVVTNETRQIPDFLALASLAAEVKKVAKASEGSSFARDRRTDKAPGRTARLAVTSTGLLQRP